MRRQCLIKSLKVLLLAMMTWFEKLAGSSAWEAGQWNSVKRFREKKKQAAKEGA